MNGRRDVCQLTDQRAVGPLQMHPDPPPPLPRTLSTPLPPSLPPPPGHHPSPLDEWGSLRYQLCHHAGVGTKILQLPVPFKT